MLTFLIFVLPRNTNTFWMSTGMFPQEFIIRFAEPTMVSVVTVDSYNGTDEFRVKSKEGT